MPLPVEQVLRGQQVGRIIALGEPRIYRRQYLPRLVATALRNACAGKAERGTQLEEQGALLSGYA